MNLRSQNFILSILCVFFLMIILGLALWMWFGVQIESVDHQLKNI